VKPETSPDTQDDRARSLEKSARKKERGAFKQSAQLPNAAMFRTLS